MASGSGVSDADAPASAPDSRSKASVVVFGNGMTSFQICRHCERSEAIQKSHHWDSVDCFVVSLLAMTWMGRRVPEKPKAAYAGAIALVRFSATLSRKPVVESQRWSAPTRSARSLVM